MQGRKEKVEQREGGEKEEIGQRPGWGADHGKLCWSSGGPWLLHQVS